MTNAVLIGLLVAADRVLKLLAETLLADGETRVLIPGILGAHLLKGGNSGAAFGILSELTGLLTAFSVICVIILLYLILFKKAASKWAQASLILLAAGAMGNLYDRMMYKSVTDYFEFLFMDFPIFNLADVMVDVGAVILMICILRTPKDGHFFVTDEPAPAEDTDGNSGI